MCVQMNTLAIVLQSLCNVFTSGRCPAKILALLRIVVIVTTKI